MIKIFQFLQKKLGITAGYSTFSMEALETNVFMGNVHVLVDESSRSSWAEILDEFGNLQEHELRGYWKFIQYHSEVDIGTFWRDSEC